MQLYSPTYGVAYITRTSFNRRPKVVAQSGSRLVYGKDAERLQGSIMGYQWTLDKATCWLSKVKRGPDWRQLAPDVPEPEHNQLSNLILKNIIASRTAMWQSEHAEMILSKARRDYTSKIRQQY